jgi:hypothetical protein
MAAGSWDAGISAHLAGTLELVLTATPLRFIGETGPTDHVTLPPGGGVIGRHPLASARLPREAATVSRTHLAFAPLGLTWHLWDCESAHGTALFLPDGERRRLVAWVPVPIRGRQRLELAATLPVDVYVRGAAAAGTLAAGTDTPTLIVDEDLETAARALVAERRDNPANRHVPAVLELAAALYCSAGTVYNRLRELSELPAVIERLDPLEDQRLDRVALADALVTAYPYLLLDVPRAP